MSEILSIYRHYVAGKYDEIDLASVVEAVLSERSPIIFQRHPLGFYHGELSSVLPLSAGERFRLHVWLGDTETTDQLGDLHEHTWELTSLVLAGAVIDRNYEAIPSLDGEFSGARIVYGETNTTLPMGRYDLRFVRESFVTCGNVYTVPSRTIHLNRVGEVPTATLVRSVEDGLSLGPLVLMPSSEAQGDATGVRHEVDGFDVLSRLSDSLAR